MKTISTFALLLTFFLAAKSQTSLYYTKGSDTFIDSTGNETKLKLKKGDCLMVESNVVYKKKYIHCTKVKDGTKGFLEQKKIIKERTFAGDTTGDKALEVIKSLYFQPITRLKNTSKRNRMVITILGKKYDFNPGDKIELRVQPGKLRYKIESEGYQPLYTEDMFEPYQIVETDFDK